MAYKKNFIYRAILVIILIITILSFSACETLPEGEPPKGPIVTIENTTNQPMSVKAAMNQMITALATSPELTVEKENNLPNIMPGSVTAPEDHKTQLGILPINVYSELLTMGVLDVDPTKPANYVLSSSFVKLVKPPAELKGKPAFKWEMSLSKPGASKPAWSYSLKIYLEQ